MPTVSVVMPMYNSVKYVSQAINSLLNQTYTDIDVIAINDGSKDGCADVVREIHDDRLIFIDRENHGFVDTLNECIKMARGKYIARLDDDDWCYPTRIEKQVVFLNEHPDVVLVGTLYEIQKEDGIVEIPEDKFIPKHLFTPEQIKYSLVFENFAFVHSSFMMRKDVLDKNKIQYETFKQCPDYHMITQLCKYGKIARIPERLVVYRIHPSQSTQVRSARMKQDEIDRAREWFISSLNMTELQKSALKKGVLRKLKTRQDINSFNDALREWKKQCGLDDKEDHACLSILYGLCLRTQFCTPHLLYEYIKSEKAGWLLPTHAIRFIVKSLISRNKHYLETEVDT